MSGVEHHAVSDDEAGLRLDRWFRRHFPELKHGRLERLLRKGQVRVDGARAKSGQRLNPGQDIRVPPLDDKPAAKPPRPVDDKVADDLYRRLLHHDDAVLVIDKPAGLAVQGGSRTSRHLDGMLDALRFNLKERPRLVHRLDRDTSGVLVLARTAKAAAALTAAFRDQATQKLYWAIVVGVPEAARGRIDLPLAKRPAPGGGERVRVDHREGRPALTDFAVLDRIGRQAAWLALAPRTGRTHQLRAHCAAIGTPILGDGKYGGKAAFLPGMELPDGMNLHARAIDIPHPLGGRLQVQASPPPEFRKTLTILGFDAAAGNVADPFAEDTL